MEDILSYELTDFLLFSPAIYYRLIAAYNSEVWIWQIPSGLCLAVAIWYWLNSSEQRPLWLFTAISFISVGWFFFIGRFSVIMPQAQYFGLGFIFQGILILLASLKSAPGNASERAAGSAYLDAVIILLLLVAYPAVSLLTEYGGSSYALWGFTPDPTVAIFLFVTHTDSRPPWWLFPVPLLWCLASTLLLWAMESAEFWLLPLLVLASYLTSRYGKAKINALLGHLQIHR